MAKYKNKYRIESIRLQGWDYRNTGAYFITICTHERQHFFGECRNGKMRLSTAGAIVQGFWFEIPKHSDHVQLGEFVVMPNHVHGILILSEMDDDVKTSKFDVSTSSSSVSTPTTDPDFFKKITPKSGSVSRIIQQYKRVCTIHINDNFPDLNFKWQTRFHDHIIRNEQSFFNISNYILKNPERWEEDRFSDESNPEL